MTPEQSARQSDLVAKIAVHVGRLNEESAIEIGMVSSDLMWALDRLRDHYLEMQGDELRVGRPGARQDRMARAEASGSGVRYRDVLAEERELVGDDRGE